MIEKIQINTPVLRILPLEEWNVGRKQYQTNLLAFCNSPLLEGCLKGGVFLCTNRSNLNPAAANTKPDSFRVSKANDGTATRRKQKPDFQIKILIIKIVFFTFSSLKQNYVANHSLVLFNRILFSINNYLICNLERFIRQQLIFRCKQELEMVFSSLWNDWNGTFRRNIYFCSGRSRRTRRQSVPIFSVRFG